MRRKENVLSSRAWLTPQLYKSLQIPLVFNTTSGSSGRGNFSARGMARKDLNRSSAPLLKRGPGLNVVQTMKKIIVMTIDSLRKDLT
jgi:hypothetical protein